MAGIPVESTLTLNTESPLIKKINEYCESNPDKAEKIAKQVFILAKMTQRRLSPEEMTEFLSDSYQILENI